jgi:acetyl-CoA acyltransferase 1
MLVTDHVVLLSIAGSGMGAAAVFERGDSVDELSNARHIQSHNFLSKDVKK